MTNPPRTVADPANATIGRLSIVDADNDTVEVAATYPGHTTITLWTDPSGVDLTAAGARNLAATLTERADLIDGWCAGLVAVWVVRLVGRTRLGIVQKVTRARARRTPPKPPQTSNNDHQTAAPSTTEPTTTEPAAAAERPVSRPNSGTWTNAEPSPSQRRTKPTNEPGSGN